MNVVDDACLRIDPHGPVGRLGDDYHRSDVDVPLDIRIIAQYRDIHRSTFDDTRRIIDGNRCLIGHWGDRH